MAKNTRFMAVWQLRLSASEGLWLSVDGKMGLLRGKTGLGVVYIFDKMVDIVKELLLKASIYTLFMAMNTKATTLNFKNTTSKNNPLFS
jgi:hypothetical protein